MRLEELNPMKRKLIWMLGVFKAFYHRRHGQDLHMLLVNTPNPLISQLHRQVTMTADGMAPYVYSGSNKRLPAETQSRYRSMILEPMEFLLSIALIDSAYIDPFLYNAYLFGRRCREDLAFWDYLETHKKEPSEWYYNVWGRFKEETVLQRESGRLDDGVKSDSESLMVDEDNTLRMREYHRKRLERHRKHDHW